MRVHFSSPPWQAALAILTVSTAVVSCKPPEGANREGLGESSKACARRDASACFYAGVLSADATGAPTQDSLRFWVKACALKHAESCDAIATAKGPMREAALVEACNSGDIVSCNRRAGEFSQDDRGFGEARALRQNICRISTAITPQTSGRDLRGTAEACAALARMVANGQGGGKDELAAVKLEVLATTLRTEALFRHEHEQDGRPAPAIAPPEPAVLGRRGKKTGPDPAVLADKDRQRREYELSNGALEAWVNGVQSSMVAVQKSERQALAKDPSLPAVSPVDRALMGATGGAVVAQSKCQACVDNCGSLERCAADDFAGGRCSHLRCAPGTSCPPFDACVAECTAKADTCARACGDCNASAPKGTK